MSLRSYLRSKFLDHAGFYQYGTPHPQPTNANSAPLETAIAPVFPDPVGMMNERFMSLSPAVDWQPVQVVLNPATGRENAQQFVDDPLMMNPNHELDGVLPYY